MRCVPRHFAHQQQRRVTQLHLLARLHGQRGNLLRIHLGHQFVNTAGDLHAVLVELVLPQHAGENRAAQSLLRGDSPWPALPRGCAGVVMA
jgi:hypothetical protein